MQSTLKKILPIANKYSAVLALFLITLYGILFVPNFLASTNITAIMFQYSIIGFLALGQLLVIITGGIDLSQGSFVALTSVVLATAMNIVGIIPSMVIAILACSGLGLITGLIVAKTNIPPFVATLGMLGIGRGLAKFVANAKPVPISDPTVRAIGRETILGVPLSFILWIIAALIMIYFLRSRRLGRFIYAVGSSEESSRLAGINIKKVKIFVYFMSALLTSFGAIIWAARLGSGSPIGGSNYEMESIAAVVVGGASLAGGVGSVVGTMAGVLLFGVINSILNLSGISPFWQGAIKGAIILLAVILSQIQQYKSKKQ